MEAGPLGEDRQRQDLAVGEQGQPGLLGGADERCSIHQSSIWTYNETKKESNPSRGTTFGRRFGASIRSQPFLCAPQLRARRLRVAPGAYIQIYLL